MRSEEPAALAADYAALAEKLGLPEANLPEQRRAVEAVRTWLGHNGNWLLVFDNARTRDEVKDYLPPGATGHVIITSRSRNWSGVAQALPVIVMPPDEAIAFLLKRTSQTDEHEAATLADALGRLPLALEQAGAYIDDAGCSFAEYTRLFEQRHQELLSTDTPPADYPDTVATTWDISFDEARRQAPAAEDFMHLCAFLAPDDIPLDIIREGTEHLPESLATEVKDPLAFNKIIAALRRYSLIERSDDNISIHRLVQLVLRNRLPEAAAKTWAEAAVMLVDKAFPFGSDDVRRWPVCLKLLPHSLIVIEHAKALQLVSQPSGRLLNQAGMYLFGRAEFAEARNMFEQSVALAEEIYGADHPVVASGLSSLGELLRQQRDLAGAKVNSERALKIAEAARNPERRLVAICLNNLGIIFKDQGDLEAALTYFQRALVIDETEYGASHPNIAIRLSNIAMVLHDKGDLAGARSHLERALVIDEAEYGKEHPSVAVDLNNLALVLKDQGDIEVAHTYCERALCILRKFLDEDHPYTMTVEMNVAFLEKLVARGRGVL